MKQILIPIDFSKNSKNAVHYAMDLYYEIPCHFFILYVNVEGADYMENPMPFLILPKIQGPTLS